jgi:Nif-specific regulatory protein
MVKTVMCASLALPQELIGAIYVDSLDFLKSYNEDDLHLLLNIASQAAVALHNARAYTSSRREVGQLRKHLQREIEIVGTSRAMQQVMQLVERVAATDATVLLTGGTGTGKEMIARRIHFASKRRNGPFVPIDCTALAETLLESELFGHEKGAFTGAHKSKQGKFELASGGTVFLDEIGNMDNNTQMKLLRVLEERAFTRAGGVKLIHVDVRIIAATNADLPALVEQGKFREDLYFRLAVFPIQLPPLRERRQDIPLLVQHFLKRFAQETGKKVHRISPPAMQLLMSYHWPGNVRELRNAIQRGVVLCDGETIDVEHLPPEISSADARAQGRALALGRKIEYVDRPLQEVVAELECEYIRRALQQCGGKKIEAARILGISRPTLDKKIKEYGL